MPADKAKTTPTAKSEMLGNTYDSAKLKKELKQPTARYIENAATAKKTDAKKHFFIVL